MSYQNYTCIFAKSTVHAYRTNNDLYLISSSSVMCALMYVLHIVYEDVKSRIIMAWHIVELGNITILSFIVILKCHDNWYRR